MCDPASNKCAITEPQFSPILNYMSCILRAGVLVKLCAPSFIEWMPSTVIVATVGRSLYLLQQAHISQHCSMNNYKELKGLRYWLRPLIWFSVMPNITFLVAFLVHTRIIIMVGSEENSSLKKRRRHVKISPLAAASSVIENFLFRGVDDAQKCSSLNDYCRLHRSARDRALPLHCSFPEQVRPRLRNLPEFWLSSTTAWRVPRSAVR